MNKPTDLHPVRGQIRWLPTWVPVTAEDALLVVCALVWIDAITKFIRP